MPSEEATIYEQGDIKITNLRAVFGSKTYSVSNISAVEEDVKVPSHAGALILCMIGGFGILLFIISLINSFSAPSYDATMNTSRAINWVSLAVGVVFIAVGVPMFRSGKNTYTIKVSTSSGEIKAFETRSAELSNGIVEALNTAIIQKG